MDAARSPDLPPHRAVILDEVVGYIVGKLLAGVLGPVFRPIGRLASRLLSRAVVITLWAAALGSYVLFPAAMSASSSAVRLLGLAAFLAMTPLALVAAIEWRGRQRAARIPYPVRGRPWVPQE